MFIIRILLFVVLALLAFVVYGAIAAFVSGLRGLTSNRKPLCPNCRGTGWVTLDRSTQRSCDCGIVPAEKKGPIIDVPDR